MGDVGMVERRERVGFAVEASEPIGLLRERVGQNLQRDVAMELRVVGAIDLPHAADTQQRSDVIDADRLPDQIHSQMPNGGV